MLTCLYEPQNFAFFRQKIIIELLVLFHSHASRVTGAFKFLAKHDDEFKCDGKKFTKEDMANYIKPRFLGKC